MGAPRVARPSIKCGQDKLLLIGEVNVTKSAHISLARKMTTAQQYISGKRESVREQHSTDAPNIPPPG